MAQTPFFLKLFKDSPLKGIEQHMEKSAECTAALEQFFEAALQENWSAAEQLYEQISSLENDADDMKQTIRSNMPRTLLMPISRQDLLELLHTQDKIPNTARDIAGLITGRQMAFPSEMHEGLMHVVRDGIRAASLVNVALERLQDVTHLGFSDKPTDSLEDILDSLGDVEHDCDLKLRELRRTLYQLEDSLDPVKVMFIYRIIDLIGDISDNAQATGNRILYITFS